MQLAWMKRSKMLRPDDSKSRKASIERDSGCQENGKPIKFAILDVCGYNILDDCRIPA